MAGNKGETWEDIKIKGMEWREIKDRDITWDEVVRKYPNKWVVLVNARFEDERHRMGILGGDVLGVADNEIEMYSGIPDDYEGWVTCRHTGEEGVEESGVLISDC